MNQQINNYCLNPDVLKWARITIGYSLNQAAKKLEVDIEKLQNWEQGSEEAPIKKIRKFAEVYKRATTVFLLNSIPEEDVSPKFRKMLYDNINSFTTETLLAIRKAISIQNLSKDIVGNRINSFIVTIQKLKTLSNYENVALEIIKLLDLDEKDITAPKDVYKQLNLWKNAIESKGIYVIEVGFPVEEARGLAIYDEVCPVIILNTNDHPRVRIFTLLHELSHFMFGTDAIDDISTLFNFSSEYKLQTACNNLAGNILIPASYLKEKVTSLELDLENEIDTSIEVLARVFHVSKQVALRRLYTQQYIQKNDFVKITKMLRDSYASGLHEGRKPTGGNFYIKFMKNNSKAFIYDVLEAYRINKIGYFEVLSSLNIKSSTLSKLESRL